MTTRQHPSPIWYALQGRMPWLARAAAWLRHDIGNDIVTAPLEPILHASRWRVAWGGIFTMIGHPLFGWIWLYSLPQPWESMALRIALGSLGATLLIVAVKLDPWSRATHVTFNLIWWIELPLFFSWMYLCNGGNSVWLASTVAMILIYYHSVDWRIATAGVALGAIVAGILFEAFGPLLSQLPPSAGNHATTNFVVLGFFWLAAVVLGFSTANQRRLNLNRTLATMGIMAHELRTPLATVSLISQALHGIAQSAEGHVATSIEPLSNRLAVLVRNMNHQIDSQIINARMLRLTQVRDSVGAGALVTEVISNYPFRNTQERNAVVVAVAHDFLFRGSHALFAQVLENLLKNAFKALAAADAPLTHGDIRIEVDATQARGKLTFSDRGVGMAPALRHRIFDPFFSSDNHQGHGLGLPFCKRVISGAGGTIRVQSNPGQGAAFTIELPIAR